MGLRIGVLSLIIVAVTAVPAPAADPNEFLVWSTAGLPGRLFVPTDYDPGRSYPLILYLHGAGLAGTDNVRQVNTSIDNVLAAAKQRGALLYAPQSPVGAWANVESTPPVQLQQAVAMLDTTAAAYNVDRDRLYVTGFSAGGGGAWDALATFPGTFAAGVPICGTLGSSVFRPSLVDVPIWTFHAADDPTVPVSNTRNMFNAIATAGGSPTQPFPPLAPTEYALYSDDPLHYLELGSGGHDIWRDVYGFPPLYDWMFAQSIPEPCAALVNAPAVFLLMRRRRSRPHIGRAG